MLSNLTGDLYAVQLSSKSDVHNDKIRNTAPHFLKRFFPCGDTPARFKPHTRKGLDNVHGNYELIFYNKHTGSILHPDHSRFHSRIYYH